MLWKALSCAIAACAGMALANSAVFAATAQEQRAKKTAEIPRCAQSLGVLAVSQPERNWWSELQLGSPEALLRVFVQQSGCFTQVDRGAGLAAAQRERALASGGNLQQGSNVGGGQIQAADYVLVPDIVSQNANARGNNFGAALGGLLGARNPVLGQLAGSISINSSTADVTLTITDVRSTRQLAIIEGHSEKTRHRLRRRRRRVRRQRLRRRRAPPVTTTPKSARSSRSPISMRIRSSSTSSAACRRKALRQPTPQQAVVVTRPTRMYQERRPRRARSCTRSISARGSIPPATRTA